MATEPSGVMDTGGGSGGSYGGQVPPYSNLSSTGHFGVFDAADEEVHFSRVVLAHQQPFAGAAAAFHYSHQAPGRSQQQHHYQQHQQQRAPSAPSGPPLLTAASAGSPNGFTDINLADHYHRPTAAAVAGGSGDDEQTKSSRLLHSIGSKLRRGSNYLVAPKLVGQYLLGITIQSWSEFLNTSHMMRAPSNTHQLTRRLINNLSYFQGNYLCVSLVLIIYCILTSPLLLLALIAYLATLYFVTARSATGRHLKLLGGYRPNLQQQYSFITLVSLPLLWVAGAPSAVFWVIGASFVVIGLHASMYSCAERMPSELTAAGSGTGCAADLANNRMVAQYYNHRRHQPVAAAAQQHYLPLGSPAQIKETSSGYSNTITQWMSFGGGSSSTKHSSHQRHQRSAGSSSSSVSWAATAQPRALDVKIISQDYAGLGRVYEV